MIPAIGRFVEALREGGVHASPAEVIDAVRAVESVGFENRASFRAALRVSLAKGRRATSVFDRVFDSFFAPPPRSRDRARRGEGPGIGGATRTGEGARERPDTRPSEREPRARRSGRERAADRGTQTADERERARRIVEAAREGRFRRDGRLRKVHETRRPVDGGVRAPLDPRRRDLSRPMGTDDERALAREAARVMEEIRLRVARRRRRSARGELWARQVFRENLSRGGVPFVLPRRAPRRRRPRIVLLVDVSYSVVRAAGLFLQMALAFLERARRPRVVLFVDRAVDATRALDRWRRSRGSASPPEPRRPLPARNARGRRGPSPGAGIGPSRHSFADLLASLPGLNLDAPSDYGRALHGLLQSQLRPGGRDTVLAVLGDARTNRFDPLPWTLEEISRRCRAIVWLVPEPRSRWGTADSAIASYLPHVDTVVEATDLTGLARGVAELVRRT